MPPTIIFQGKEASLLELALFRTLGPQPLDADTLAQRLALHPQRARELFNALADGGLLERLGERYANIEEVDELLGQIKGAGRLRGGRGIGWLLSALLALFLVVAVVQGRFALRTEVSSAQSNGPAGMLLGGGATAPAQKGHEPTFTYFLVSSPEQANLVESVLRTEAENASVATGRASPHNIIVVRSPEDETRMREALDSGFEAANHGGALPRIVDLRPATPASGKAPSPGPIVAEPPGTDVPPVSSGPFTYYLVNSEEQADQVRGELNGQTGGPGLSSGAPPDTLVVVLGSPEEEQHFCWAISEPDRDPGFDEPHRALTIVDLRPPAGPSTRCWAKVLPR